MDQEVRKGHGRMNTLLVVSFVVVLVMLIAAQTWPNIIGALRPVDASGVHARALTTTSPTATGFPTSIPKSVQ